MITLAYLNDLYSHPSKKSETKRRAAIKHPLYAIK